MRDLESGLTVVYGEDIPDETYRELIEEQFDDDPAGYLVFDMPRRRAERFRPSPQRDRGRHGCAPAPGRTMLGR